MTKGTDMILPMLRDMRAESEARHGEVLRRLDRLEATQKSFTQAFSGDSLMSKLVTGEFETRNETLERKMRQLEKQK